MEVKLEQKVGARFKLVVKKADETVSKETGWFDNLVLDSGLARMSVGRWIDRCCVGSGNDTPVPSQTTLSSFVASTTTSQNEFATIQTTTAPFYRSYTLTWRFGLGVAAGNISEVGLGWTNTNLWNRTLVKDAEGNPTTITILSDEYLDVVSEIREYPQQSLAGSFNLLDKNGGIISTHTYIGYPVMRNVVKSFGAISLTNSTANGAYATYIHAGSITSNPTTTDIGSPAASIGSNPPTYSGNTLTQIYTIGLNEANFAQKGFFISYANGSIMAGQNASGYKLEINPPITKTTTQTMTYTFNLSWDRYTA